MPYQINERYHAVVISLEDKFQGIIEGQSLLDSITDLKDQRKINVIVDFSKTEYIDSTGIGVLISSLTSLRKVGGDIRLTGLNKRIKTIFLTTRLLGRVFTEYYSVEAALDSYRLDPPRLEVASLD